MRKILALVVAILAISLYSCEKDEKQTNPLIGEWALQSQEESGKEFIRECQEFSYLVFSKNHLENHLFRHRNHTCEDTYLGKAAYTINDNKFTFEENGQKFTYSFSVEGDILTIKTEGGTTITYKKNARKTPPAVPVNPFMGAWKLEKSLNNGVDYTNDCSRKSTIVFTENTIIINYSEIEVLDKSCISDKTELTYTYSNGKVSNIKLKPKENIVDNVTFVVENDLLIMTRVIDGDKLVDTFKKQ